ncbi:hypothetical protein ACFLY6_02420 [Candidatus Dependentiae bacterium]
MKAFSRKIVFALLFSCCCSFFLKVVGQQAQFLTGPDGQPVYAGGKPLCFFPMEGKMGPCPPAMQGFPAPSAPPSYPELPPPPHYSLTDREVALDMQEEMAQEGNVSPQQQRLLDQKRYLEEAADKLETEEISRRAQIKGQFKKEKTAIKKEFRSLVKPKWKIWRRKTVKERAAEELRKGELAKLEVAYDRPSDEIVKLKEQILELTEQISDLEDDEEKRRELERQKIDEEQQRQLEMMQQQIRQGFGAAATSFGAPGYGYYPMHIPQPVQPPSYQQAMKQPSMYPQQPQPLAPPMYPQIQQQPQQPQPLAPPHPSAPPN